MGILLEEELQHLKCKGYFRVNGCQIGSRKEMILEGEETRTVVSRNPLL
jgi:hypothetical protein